MNVKFHKFNFEKIIYIDDANYISVYNLWFLLFNDKYRIRDNLLEGIENILNECNYN